MSGVNWVTMKGFVYVMCVGSVRILAKYVSFPLPVLQPHINGFLSVLENKHLGIILFKKGFHYFF